MQLIRPACVSGAPRIVILHWSQMEQFREESRVEEQKRATAVAARQEAEQRVAELEAAVSAKAAALHAAEQDSDAKAAAAAETVCPVMTRYHCSCWGCFGRLRCRAHIRLALIRHARN
jgi:hypothetical protein